MLNKNTNKRFFLIVNFILTLFVVFITTPIQTIRGANSFAVTGNFPEYHYKMVIGETMETPAVFALFFNNYDKDIRVELTPETPLGVSFHLSTEPITIPRKIENEDGSTSGGFLKVPIGLTTSIDAIPGIYTIKLGAKVVPDVINGISIVGSAELSTQLTIYGEAGTINAQTVSYTGSNFSSEIYIYRVDGDNLVPVSYTENGIITDRLIPGKYRIIAYYNGTIVAQQDVDLEDKEVIDLELVATTVSIPTFLVGPQFDEETKLFSSVLIAYTVSNVFEPVTNVRLTLIVTFEGEFEEEIDVLTVDYLDDRPLSSKTTYIPKDGWLNGLYTFRLEAYQENSSGVREDDFFLATSVIREAPIEVPETINIGFVVIVIVGGIVVFLFISLMGIVLFGKRKKQENCEELLEKANQAVKDVETIVYGQNPHVKVPKKLTVNAEKTLEMAKDCKGVKAIEDRYQKVLEAQVDQAIQSKLNVPANPSVVNHSDESKSPSESEINEVVQSPKDNAEKLLPSKKNKGAKK